MKGLKRRPLYYLAVIMEALPMLEEELIIFHYVEAKEIHMREASG